MARPRSLAFWLALVDRLVEERFSAALEEHGVTRLQWRILGALSSGSANAEELDELMVSGWVVAGDGRFTLTERGRSAHDGLDEVVTALRTTLIDGVPQDEQDRTAVTLERMARNLGWGS